MERVGASHQRNARLNSAVLSELYLLKVEVGDSSHKFKLADNFLIVGTVQERLHGWPKAITGWIST